jgi:hypothetical protein
LGISVLNLKQLEIHHPDGQHADKLNVIGSILYCSETKVEPKIENSVRAEEEESIGTT